MSDKRVPSLMLRKFLEDNKTGASQQQIQTDFGDSPEEGQPRAPFQREYCFLYGTLMDPETLSRVLKLSRPGPVMRRAKVIGYKTKLWGPYPALLNGEPLHPVNGMACEILSQTQLDRLSEYETDKYRLRPCLIELLDDQGAIEKTVEGVTFMWNGQQDELRDGNFDLKHWRKEQQLQDLD